jgi:uncharacterized cupin superfamily protein
MSKNGLVVDGAGWFILNARESRWRNEGPLGSYCTFEGKRRFPQLGINVSVLEPGEAMGMYHRENAQEGFLVVAGECLLIVEEQERKLRAWDYVHCPGGTAHIIVATGEEAAIVVAIGARGRSVGGGIVYLVSETAARYGARVERERRAQPRRTRRRMPICRGRSSSSTAQDGCLSNGGCPALPPGLTRWGGRGVGNLPASSGRRLWRRQKGGRQWVRD